MRHRELPRETTVNRVGSPVTLATFANAGQFARDFLTTLNHGHAISLPSVPITQRVSVTLKGTGYSYSVSPQVAGGELAVSLSNHELSRSGGFHLVVGRLSGGKTLSDVNDVIGAVTSRRPPVGSTSFPPCPRRQLQRRSGVYRSSQAATYWCVPVTRLVHCAR